jgi:dihydroorotase-like cyclic amidohydrolase
MKVDTIIENGKVVTPGGILEAVIGIDKGQIVFIGNSLDGIDVGEKIDAGGRYIIPGLVDPHTHILANWMSTWPELAWTESRAAVAGGVTTLTLYLRTREDSYFANIDLMVDALESNATCDTFFHITLESDTQIEEITEYAELFGPRMFKVYLGGYPPNNEINMRIMDTGLLYQVMQKVGRLGPGYKVGVHPEDVWIVEREMQKAKAMGGQMVRDYCDARPALAEEMDIYRAFRLGRAADCHVYIPHLTIGSAVPMYRWQKEHGDLRATLETCPQYLALVKDDPTLPMSAKCNPPLRSQEEQDLLWQALRDGEISCVGTDHISTTKGLRGNDLWWEVPGFAGLETALPILLSEGVNKGRISLERMVEVACANPAREFGLYPRKGALMVGSDADLVVIDLERERAVRGADQYTQGTTPMEGRTYKGWPVLTMVRGKTVFRDGELTGERGYGVLLNEISVEGRRRMEEVRVHRAQEQPAELA